MAESTTKTSVADPQALIEQLRVLTSTPGAYFESEAQKREFQSLIRGATAAVEEPFETMQRLVYGPLPLVTARISQSHNIFSTLCESKDAVDLNTISRKSGLQPGVLGSIMDYLCTQGMALEADRGCYTPTPLSHMLLVPLFNDAVTHFHDNCFPAFFALHQVLNDPAPGKTAFKVGQHSNEDFYTWMETHPIQQGAFHRFMEAQFAMLPTWLDVISFQAEVAEGSAKDDILFVDVGGGNGSQCAALKKAFPELAGRIILQDRPAVLGKALDVEGMERMAHDFLTEQPVKNARAYYFRQIMHNYDDETCVQILRFHIPAMGPDSRIFIDDKTLPDEKPGAGAPGVEYTAALSLAMKAMFDAQERREAHWRRLLDEAGLKILDIRKFTKFDDSVIIATKK
ncbi:putative sterigmatocystin 8-O-methyltransferase precursor [Corynespora cassiicola Philippines]|uniref:Putative sterigmatocystin 8-O-methyltransferase n=1 Tax=Corynespora cassiicola Philippines TaxID=1448308 RepID=A0A2T2NIJ2_CORCC|nr:putative sterigmatocystin 8-O-methyltransferase precursor [Corynespora cassiicola Philippines]